MPSRQALYQLSHPDPLLRDKVAHSSESMLYEDFLAGNLGILWPETHPADRRWHRPPPARSPRFLWRRRCDIGKRHKGKVLSHTEGRGRARFPSILVSLPGRVGPSAELCVGQLVAASVPTSSVGAGQPVSCSTFTGKVTPQPPLTWILPAPHLPLMFFT